MGQVYKITNQTNGKCYIGATTRNFESRYLDGRWWAMTHNRELLDDAFIYGASAFLVTLLEDNIPTERLQEVENRYIKENNSITPNGYNNTTSNSVFVERSLVTQQKKARLRKQKRELQRREFYSQVKETNVEIRDAVRTFRKILGMTQRDFAKFTGISPRILMQFEQGKGNPTIATILKLLKGSGLILTLKTKA